MAGVRSGAKPFAVATARRPEGSNPFALARTPVAQLPVRPVLPT
ncbi:hypothetical protein [Azospirillum doebereinerae]